MKFVLISLDLLTVQCRFKSKIFVTMTTDENYQEPKELDYDIEKTPEENMEFYLQKTLSFLESI